MLATCDALAATGAQQLQFRSCRRRSDGRTRFSMVAPSAPRDA